MNELTAGLGGAVCVPTKGLVIHTKALRTTHGIDSELKKLFAEIPSFVV